MKRQWAASPKFLGPFKLRQVLKTTQLIRAFLTGCLCWCAADAYANVQVFPTRVVLSDQSRISQLTITHTGKTPLTYEVVPIFYSQNESGVMKSVEGAEVDRQERSLAPFLRYSPRVFTLKTGETQVIKVRAQTKPELSDGTYRVHLRIQPAPNEAQTQAIRGAKAGESVVRKNKEGGSSLELTALLAVAVPVYFQHGSNNLVVEFSNPRIENGGKTIGFDLVQKGSGFIFGDLLISLKEGKKEAREIGRMLGMASYAPKRRFEVPLDSPISAQRSGDQILRIEIRQSPDEGQNVLQSFEVPLSKL